MATDIKKQMEANSKAWHTADAATKKKLEAANQKLGKQIGGNYNPTTGTWSDSSGNSLYGSSGNKNNAISSGNKNNAISSGNGTSSSGRNVTTNSSYNGNYLTINTGADYQAQINAAVAKGDYVSAAQYEALRNAKINYLNKVGENYYGASLSNNYTSTDKNKNNQDGYSYSGGYNSLSDLNDNWTTANVKGTIYNRDADGSIYEIGGKRADGTQSKRLMGAGLNSATGEFTFNDKESARKAAYDNYISSVGLGSGARGGGEGAYEYIRKNNLVDEAYVDALQTGTTGQYNTDLIAKIDAENKRLAILAAQKEEEEEERAWQEEQAYNARNYGSSNNSFEANTNNTGNSSNAQNNQGSGYGLENENYLQNRRGQIFRGLSNRY